MIRTVISALMMLFLMAGHSYAVLPDEVLKDAVLEQRARNLSSQLRCMVCQNQSIDDSDAELARDLRVLVRERISQGDSDQAVMDYVVSRYGEFVLLKPKFNLRNAVLWLIPVILILCGAIAILIYARTRPSIATTKKLTDDEEKKVNDILNDR